MAPAGNCPSCSSSFTRPRLGILARSWGCGGPRPSRMANGAIAQLRIDCGCSSSQCSRRPTASIGGIRGHEAQLAQLVPPTMKAQLPAQKLGLRSIPPPLLTGRPAAHAPSMASTHPSHECERIVLWAIELSPGRCASASGTCTVPIGRRRQSTLSPNTAPSPSTSSPRVTPSGGFGQGSLELWHLHAAPWPGSLPGQIQLPCYHAPP